MTEDNVAAEIESDVVDTLGDMMPGSGDEPEEETEDVTAEPTDGPEKEEPGAEEDEVSDATQTKPVETVEEETVEEVEDTGASVSASTEEPGADVVADEPVVDEVDLQAQNALLLKRIEELSGQVLTGQPKAQPPVQQQEQPSAPVTQPVPATQATAADFLAGLDIDEVVSDPKLFNQVINKAIQHGASSTVEHVLKAIPKIVMSQINQQSAVTGAVSDFYTSNPDLVTIKQTVGIVANEVANENPGWEVGKILDEAATRTRTLVGLRKQAVGQPAPTIAQPAQRRTPAFVSKPAARKATAKPKLSKLQSEINELI